MIEINVFLCPWLPRGLLNNNSTALRMLLPAFWCCDKNKSDLYEIILMVWEVSAVLPIWFIICFRTNGSRSYYYCTFLKWEHVRATLTEERVTWRLRTAQIQFGSTPRWLPYSYVWVRTSLGFQLMTVDLQSRRLRGRRIRGGGWIVCDERPAEK